MKRAIDRFLAHVLPHRCLLCRQSTASHQPLCHCCYDDINRFEYHQIDNLLLRPDIQAAIKQPGFERLISVAPYQWPYDRWISELKFRQNFNLATMLADQLLALLQALAVVSKHRPTVILPMPIHKKRHFERGYNQALLLSQPLAQGLEIPLDSHSLLRVKSTQAQSTLNKRQRRRNIHQAFVYDGPTYSHVALVDDVITTGATVNEVCRCLRRSGIEHISLWSICVTL